MFRYRRLDMADFRARSPDTPNGSGLETIPVLPRNAVPRAGPQTPQPIREAHPDHRVRQAGRDPKSPKTALLSAGQFAPKPKQGHGERDDLRKYCERKQAPPAVLYSESSTSNFSRNSARIRRASAARGITHSPSAAGSKKKGQMNSATCAPPLICPRGGG